MCPALKLKIKRENGSTENCNKKLKLQYLLLLKLKNFVNRNKFACSLRLCRDINLVVTV